ncbi:centriolar coiled-coil protein of 110 kDa-like isoform X2 [Branchiostoma lanceolatum]|uniref:centriolar coiled-coil protein of 110 kDa-like isoform X2 n=1 Tax=Branchiostoma lanceolatum TaxID=7740 RepID=UPI00345208D5
MAGVRISSLREVPTSLSAMPEFMDFLQSQAEALDVLTQSMDALGREEEDTGFQSCIKFNGISILPPVMDEGRRLEMQRYRQLAAGVEHRLAVQRRDRLLNRVQTVIQKIEERRTPTPVISPGMSNGDLPGVHAASSSHNSPSIPYNPLNYSFHDPQSDTLSSSDRDTPRDNDADLQRNDSEAKFGPERDVADHDPGRSDEGSVDGSRQRYGRESSNQSSDFGMDRDPSKKSNEAVVERRKWSSEGEDSTSGQSPSSDGFEGRVRSETVSTEESETRQRADSSSGDDWVGRDRSNTGTTEESVEEVDYYGMSLQNLIRKSVEEQKADNAVQTIANNPATSESGSMIINSSTNTGDVRDDVLNNDDTEFSNNCNKEGPNITGQLKSSSSFEGDPKMERSSQCTTSSSSSSDSALNRTIIAKDESLQDKLTEVQGEGPGHGDNNIQGTNNAIDCANAFEKQNESNSMDINKEVDRSQVGRVSTVDSGVGTVESRIRSGTDDSVTSLLGEYTPLPTVSPNVTPDVSDILPPHGGPAVQSDMSDTVPPSGGEEPSQRTSMANSRQEDKLPEPTEEPSAHTQTLTTSSMFFMSTDESLNTVAQSCTLPISPVSEDSDATLRDVTDFDEERTSATPVPDKQQTKPDASSTIAGKHSSNDDIYTHSSSSKQSPHEGQELTTKKGDEVSTPKHVRRGSYTLDMPSPALLQAEEKQKVSPEGRSDYLVRQPAQFPVQSRQNAQRSGVYIPDSGFTTRYNNTVPATSGASQLPTTTSVTSMTTPYNPYQHGQQPQHTSIPNSSDVVSGETQRNAAPDGSAEASHVPTINPEFLEQELEKYEDLKALMQHQHKMQLALLIQEQERQRLAMHQELELQEERIKMQKNKLQEQYSRQAELSEQERWSESAAALRQLEGRDALPPSPTHNFSRPILHRTAPVTAASVQYSVTVPGTGTANPSFPNQGILSKGQLTGEVIPSDSTGEDAGWRRTESDTSTSYASPSTTHSETASISQRDAVRMGVQEPFVWHGSPVPKPEVQPPLRMTIHDMTAVPPNVQSKFERLSAAVKGYLTRRLLRTEKVQALRKTIKDTTELIMSLQQETPIRKGMVTTQDAELVQRVMVQLQAALLEVHDVFFQLPVQGQMVIISQDRNIQEERSMKMNKAEARAAEKRPSRLSSATQKALQRKRQIRAAEAAVFGHSLTAPPRSSSTSPSRRKNTINPRAAKHATKASEVRPKTAPNLNKDKGKPAKATSGPKTARRSLYSTVSTMPAKGKNTKYRK